MVVTVAKEFRWEMGHRLPYHETCQNVHGHSYRMVLEAEGEPDGSGMVVDFGVIADIVKPLVSELDHSFMVDPSDHLMHDLLSRSGLKKTEVPFYSTAENIAGWILGRVAPVLFESSNVSTIRVKLFETVSSCATVETSR